MFLRRQHCDFIALPCLSEAVGMEVIDVSEDLIEVDGIYIHTEDKTEATAL